MLFGFTSRIIRYVLLLLPQVCADLLVLLDPHVGAIDVRSTCVIPYCNVSELVAGVRSATTAFLYPAYASYKTLSQRPASEEELERWLMYWSVLGGVVAVEYVAEWMVSW